MFGYIIPDKNQLNDECKQRYRGYYCGLCDALRRYGVSGQAALNYDMTFLYILLSALYDESPRESERHCLPHPVRGHLHIASEAAEYCADMTVLFAYYNALDDWHDDKNAVARTYAAMLSGGARAVGERYPDKAAAIAAGMENINVLERQNEINLDAVATQFGKMLGEIFVWREDRWAPVLRTLGENLGKFVYFTDAWEDVKHDRRHKNYNPLLRLADRPDYDKMCHEILTLFMADAAGAFEALPIVGNEAAILRNILYAGAWTAYNTKSKEKHHD